MTHYIETQFNQTFGWLTNNPNFMNYSTIIIFLYAMTPSFIMLPNEALILPVVLASNDKINTIVFLAVLSGIAGFFGDSLIYFLAKHGYRLFKKKPIKMLDKKHWLHKHFVIIFLFSPWLLTFIGLAEVPLVIAGIKHIHYYRIALFLFIGNMVRSVITIVFLYNLITN